MRISKEEIESIKREHNLLRVIESYGVKLKKKGANYVGLRPFHEEKSPSFTVNPRTKLYHCFGCNAGGDVIGFISKKEGIGFREAVEKLSNNCRDGKQDKPKKPHSFTASSAAPPINRTRLLNRVASFYHWCFRV